MKLQVHTLRFGNPTWLQACAPTLDRWCERHGHELVVWDDPLDWCTYPTPKFVEMDALSKFLSGDADVFAWVDADVRVNAHAPACPEFSGIAMATCRYHAEHQTHWQDWCLEHFGDIPEGFQYSNAGVYFIDRAAAEVLAKLMKPPFIETFQEQHQWNWWVYQATQQGVPFTRLPDDWNRYGRDFEPAWLHHVWGANKDEDLETLELMGLLDKNPDDLVYNVQPPTWPSSEKVVCLEFIQDAGLGNQLFEIAASYSIARTLNLPLRWIWRPSKLRNFELTHFGFAENPYVEYPLLLSRAGQGNRKLYQTAVNRIVESNHRFCGISCPFQDEACFIDHADEIRELFRLEPFDLPNPQGTTPVGVQVRRGDYVKHSRLNVTTPEYFLGALEWIRANVENPHFIIVSDDPHYCRKLFERQFDVTVMPSQSAIEGLRTLASCKAHVVSNSTFGWWGAWLGETGPVVVPEHWHHQPGSYGDWNPVPDRWIKLPTGETPKGAKVEIPKPRVVIELPDPGVERAIVYPWHADSAKWHELRYSLRSIETFFEDKHCPIYIFGTRRPGFIKESHPRVQYRGAWSYSEALSNGVQVADKVLWMNDDICLLKPVSWADCEVPRYLREVGPEFLKHAETFNNPWRESCLRVLKQLADRGIKDQKVFSTHTPYVYERKKALRVFEEFGVWDKMPFELAFFHLFGENPQPIGDARTQELPGNGAMFLNYADRHLTPTFKAAMANRFPHFADWEVRSAF